VSKFPFSTDSRAVIGTLSGAGCERDVFARALCAARNSYLFVSLDCIILGNHGITYFENLDDFVHTPYSRSLIIVARQRTQYTLSSSVTSPSLGSLSVTQPLTTTEESRIALYTCPSSSSRGNASSEQFTFYTCGRDFGRSKTGNAATGRGLCLQMAVVRLRY
jgi:hypothetical protein